MHRIAAGVVAGAVGTMALNTTTYLDMLTTGRSPSDLPDRSAGRLLRRIAPAADAGDAGRHRRSALGHLMGSANGVGLGLLYGAAAQRLPTHRRWAAGVAVGIAAILSSQVPATLSGLTDPRRWTLHEWLSDLVPHLVFGLCVAWAFPELAGGANRDGRRA